MVILESNPPVEIKETPTMENKWHKDAVIEEFDTNWSLTMAELSRMSGWTVSELKKLLLA